MKYCKNILIAALLCLLGLHSFGQKIKYKDLFVLLSAKQYDQAEPFLKKYLVETEDNPNALLFMGYIFEEKALTNDVLTELAKIKSNTDSAVLYLDKAYKEIDEKELRKNDEFYQMYSRRDLRTGKFGLKLPDVQLDLEKRIKYLKDRKQRILLLHEKFNTTQKIYSKCELLFSEIAGRYKNNLEFYLRSDDVLKSDLRKMATRYDSCIIAFNDYKTIMTSLGKTGHNQGIEAQEIKNFKNDGFAKVNFIEDEVKFWDYKRWALSSLEVMENEIAPVRASLVKMDADLNGLREKLRKDSVTVAPEVKVLAERIQKIGLTKFDPSPMPVDIFNLKIHELNYGSFLAQTRNLRDTSNLSLKLGLYNRDIKLLTSVDSVASIIFRRDLDYDIENYKDFVRDSYGSATVLKSLIKTTSDFAITEKASREHSVKWIESAMDWIVNKNDSIPVSSKVQSKIYYPLSIVPDQYTYGLKKSDTLKAYFYSIAPSRKPVIKTELPVDTSAFHIATLNQVRNLIVSPAPDDFYFLLCSEIKKKEKYSTLILHISTQGLVWKNFTLLDGLPSELTFNPDTKNITFKVSNESGTKSIGIDKEGKLVPVN